MTHKINIHALLRIAFCLLSVCLVIPASAQLRDSIITIKPKPVKPKPAKPGAEPPSTPAKSRKFTMKRDPNEKSEPRKRITDTEIDVLRQPIVEVSDQYLDILHTVIQPIVEDTTQKVRQFSSMPITNTFVTSSHTTDSTAGQKPSIENNNNIARGLSIQTNSFFYTRFLSDSLVASSNKDFLYNNLTIINTSGETLKLLVSINVPGDWQIITNKVIEVTIGPNQNSVVPIRLLPSNNSKPTWTAVKIDYRNLTNGDVRSNAFFLKVQEFKKFKANLTIPNFVMTGFQKLITLPVYIKNSGNSPSNFTIVSSNSFFHLEDKTTITLNGNRDTIFQWSLVMSEREFSMLTKEEIKIRVSNEEDTYNLLQYISRVGYLLKEHSSAYLDMPLQIEAGILSQGTSDIQYYGGVHGSVDFAKERRVSVLYRSNTYTKNQVQPNGIIRADYAGKHVHASAGQIVEMSDFLMDGYGAKAGLNWGVDNKAVLYGQLQSRDGKSQVLGGSLLYYLRDNIRLSEAISGELNKRTNINSCIARQNIEFNFKEKVKAVLIAGYGVEQTTIDLKNSDKKNLMGSSLGYNFAYAGKIMRLTSNMLYNTNDFAGIYKGQKLQMHDLRFGGNKIFAGGYYEYNYKGRSAFVDTELVENEFNLQSDNYGGRVGLNTRSGNFILSAGQQKQVQNNQDGVDYHTVFDYLNANISLMIMKSLSLSINNYTGYGAIPEANIKKLFITSNQISLSVYTSGVSVRYDKGPFYYNDFVTYVKNKQNSERIMISPYIDFGLFHDNFRFRGQYNYFNTSESKQKSENVMINLAYSNPLNGFDFQVTGTMPIKKENTVLENTNISATLRLRLNTPFVAIKKYHSLKLVLFKDANNNDIREPDEEPIEGQTMSINGNLFVSDKNGEVIYKNVSSGNFKADLGYSSKIKGWAPRQGAIQMFAVAKSNTITNIPYRKSKVLQGQIRVLLDPNSNLKFEPANIKVTAKSEDEVVYSTLSDENGEFYFNLPDGRYIVSLSEIAFDENFKPTQWAQTADMTVNEVKTLYYEVKQKKREINIKKR